MDIKDRAETYASVIGVCMSGDKFYVEDKELVRHVCAFVQKEEE